MKYHLLLLATTLFVLTAFQPKTGSGLRGKVTDQTGEALIGASVKVTKGADFIRGAITDLDGNYRIDLDPGTYDVEFAFTGYELKRVLDVKVQAGEVSLLNVAISSGTMLNEVVVTSYKEQAREVVPTTETISLSETVVTGKKASDRAKRKAVTAAKSAPAKPAGPEHPKSPAADAATSLERPAPAVVKDELTIDFLMESLEKRVIERKVMPYAEIIASDDMATGEPVPTPGKPGQPAPRAGLLTAGEWNDLHNWNKHWQDLLADGEIDAYQKMYGFYPKQRYSVLIQNEQDLPITDAAVQLLDAKGNPLWDARTDNMGRAELWNGLNGPLANGSLSLRVWLDGQQHDLGTVKPFAEGLNRHKIQRECRHSQNLDIVWTVDATGSMGDELEYLKTELLDVMGKVKAVNPGLAVRMGSVFYRDKGDEYIVKSSALSPDITKTVDYIRQQFAGGGGDYPEAVHSALDEAIYRQPWSTEAVARICFLVLDASPHQEPEVLENLQKSIREAAKKGIRIVPVSASGIEKDTEFLMKFFGLATNGSYVFLTDHSGIGGKHLEPTTDEYKVELLNDLLVRLITEYTAVPSCEGKSTIRFNDPQAQTGQQQNNQGNAPALAPIVYYPNPASYHFTLELPFDADKVTLYDAEGKAVRDLAKMAAGVHTVQVNDLSEGFYTLRIWKDGLVQSGKVVVVRA